MRVLHVIAINGFGGAEKLLLDMLPGLQQQHVETHCLIFNNKSLPQAADKIAGELERKGIRVFRKAYGSRLAPSIFSTIRKRVAEGNYSLIHSHLKYADTWLAILKKTGSLKLPVVTTLHGYKDSYQNKYGLEYKPEIKGQLYYKITKWVYRQIDGFILISKCLDNFYNNASLLRSNARKQIIYHGYDANNIITPKDKLPVTPAPRIALPGRLITTKGHRYAITALELLQQKMPGATLHFFGEGPEEPLLRNMVEEKGLGDEVIFHGYVNDLIHRLSEFDIAVIPSLWESFGLVFLDAFKAAIPVVAFDLPAGNEIIEDGRSGLLVQACDAAALAEKIELLANDPALRTKLISGGQQRLLQDFSIERMSSEYAKFYMTVTQ